MKPFLLLALVIAAFSLSAAGQIPYSPLLPGSKPVCRMYFPNQSTDAFEVCINLPAHDPRVAQIQKQQAADYAVENPGAPAAAMDRVFTIGGGGHWPLRFYVPQPAYYAGSFEARDDGSDVRESVIDAAGRYVRMAPKGEIEIAIMEDASYLYGFSKSRSWSGVYSSGRQFSGEFRVLLTPGWYWIVMNNNFSFMRPKSVTLKLYQPQL